MTDHTIPPTRMWPCLSYADAHAAVAFLGEAFGFEALAVHEGGPDRPVAHAELAFPEGGGIMLGSAQEDGGELARRPPGASTVYTVTADPDGLFARAVAAGAEVVRPVADQDYGGREFTVRDPEGNLWSFGSYPGASGSAAS